MRIVFMGTPDFAVPSLKMLVEEGYEVAAVVTQPDKPKGRGNKLTAPPVKEYALEKGIRVLQPDKAKAPEFAVELEEIGPDLIITAAYGKILPKDVLDIPPLGCINVHGSLLPKYRGSAPIQWSIINGDKVTGITIMYMDIGMDTGDILIKREIEIPDDMDAGELFDKLAVVGAETLKDTLKMVENNTLKRVQQDEQEATYAPMMKKEAGQIDWQKSARDVHNLIRGTSPWPGAFTFYKGGRMRVWVAEVVDDSTVKGKPGLVLNISKEGMDIAAGKGLLRIKELQFDSSRKMKIEECWHNINEGEVLG